MDPILIGIIGICLLLFLIFLGVPIAFALSMVAALGIFVMTGFSQACAQLSMEVWDKGTSVVFVCAPLFVLMGQLVHHTGLGSDLYDFSRKWFGHVHGGLAITSVIASAGMAAVTGVTIAAIAAIGAMSLPEMKKYKYSVKLATGSLCTAGTLAIMIPPSLSFVIYGIMTDTSIGDLFIAGIIPGIILAVAFSVMIYIHCKINPEFGPPGPNFTWRERLLSLHQLWPVLALFLTVIGGIYAGIFTPTEAAGIGVSGVFLIGLIKRRITWNIVKLSLHNTALLGAMVFPIIVGGYFISRFLVLTEVTESIVIIIGNLQISKYSVLLLLIVLYSILGCVLDSFGMIILTIPFVFPIILRLGFDPIWFGVFVTLMVETGLVTPPVGLCAYVVKDLAPENRLEDIFVGSIPFVLILLGMAGLLIAFPEMALWLLRK
jgi:C4-dicarboxylate transporter DctM subunit